MRQHLSVLTLLTRSTIYPIAVLLAVMAAVEAVLFSLAMGANGTLSLTGMIRSSRIVWVFGAAFLLLTVLLCRTGCEFGSRQGYTLRRLSISERAVFVWQWGYNTACYLLLWWWQALIAFALCLWYASQAGPELVGSQTIFLAFYRSGLLHSLIPLEEVSRWVRNGVMALGLGACAALEPFLQRRKGLPWEILAPVSLALLFFPMELGIWGLDAALALASLLSIVRAVYRMVEEG